MEAIFFWLILFVILLVMEIVSLGLTTIWFAAGALVSCLAAILGANIYIQGTIFVAVSFVLFFVTRPIAVKYMQNHAIKTNVDEYIGKCVNVCIEIDNTKECGEVIMNGEHWMARSSEHSVIPAGTRVEIVEVQGNKLIVKETARHIDGEK